MNEHVSETFFSFSNPTTFSFSFHTLQYCHNGLCLLLLQGMIILPVVMQATFYFKAVFRSLDSLYDTDVISFQIRHG